MKRKLFLFTALLLCFALLLQGCDAVHLVKGGRNGDSGEIEESSERESRETQPKETEPKDPDINDPDNYVPYDEFPRLTVAPEEALSFADIRYERPDAKTLCEDYDTLRKSIEDGAEARDILYDFMPIYEDYLYFNTMSQYAYIRYTLDLDDSYYDEEYNWCEEQGPLIEQAQEKCFIAMGKSDARGELEEDYFGEGFFDYYDDTQVFSNDRVVELMQEESALQSEYMSMQNEMTIEWNGQEHLVDDLFSDDSLSYDDYLEIYEIYYGKYTPMATEIFIELIQVRREIAKELDYESYAHFAYDFYYFRDYTPEQVKQYTDDIASELAPYYYTAAYSSYSDAMDSGTVMETLEKVAKNFGGEIATAYDFMMDYGLYDITASPSKMPGSYMTYLSYYGMPYMYVSPTEDISDVLTAVHEFGHFVDGFVNCNYTSSIDCAEIFSQGLEFLSLTRAGFSSREEKALTESKLADSIMVFLTQGCYAEFEQRVYELSDDELTMENINEIFVDCMDKFGMGFYGLEDILGGSWIDIQHFFIAPYYVISYCISNDAALQIYQHELADGIGLDAYYDLLHLSANNTILAMLEEAGMNSPFDKGRMEELADFFEEELE